MQKRKLTKIFITDKGYEERTRNVAGVNLQTIETDFGRLNIMLNRIGLRYGNERSHGKITGLTTTTT